MADLIERMRTQIEAWEQIQDDRAIFLTCYTMMTDNMLRAIASGGFEDGVWVTTLLHRFADYYFEALAGYEASQIQPVWTFTFDMARTRRVHVLQNLLLGVNAHICYDLIFALRDSIVGEWDTLPEDGRALRYRDHCHVNAIIGATLDAVQDQVVETRNHAMIAVDDAFGRLDEWMIQALITLWREQVWQQSIALVTAPPDENDALKQAYATKAEQRSRAILGQRGILGIVDLFA